MPRRRLGRVIRSLRRRLDPPEATSADQPANAPDPAVSQVLHSGVFDVDWYSAQAGTTFTATADAVRHYLSHGRRQGWSPHPLFVPARFRPQRWDRDRADPLITYLNGGGAGWGSATSPLFDPAQLGETGDGGPGDVRDARSPLATFLADSVSAPLPVADDAAWLRDGVTLSDVRSALRAELDAQEGAGPEAAADEQAETLPSSTTLVMTDCDVTSDVLAALAAAHRAIGPVPGADGGTPEPPIEIVLLLPEHRRPAVVGLALARLARYDVRCVTATHDSSSSLAEAVRHARGEHVLLLSARQAFTEGVLADLGTTLLESDAAAAHPVVLGADLLVHDAGVVYADHGSDPVPFLHGVHPDSVKWPRPWFTVPGAALPLLARTESVRAVASASGPRTLRADIDLSQRLAAHEQRPVVVTPHVVVTRTADGVLDDTTDPLDDLHAFRRTWERVPKGSADLFAAFDLTPVFTGVTALTSPDRPADWTGALWLHAPGQPSTRAQVHEAPPALHWAVKTSMPAADRARQWGDYHFAHSLAAALRGLGQHAVVDYRPNDSRTTSYRDDVVLMLRGLHPARLPAGVITAAWVISHPDDVTAREMAGYDLRYAASLTWAAEVSARWDLPVRPLLQCTDPDRFYIDDEPVEEAVGKAVLVGNTRGTARPVALEAVRSGTPVAVYGSGWDKFLPPEAIAGTYVPNEVLRRYYRSAAWALNDHWPDMRDLGFVSNRVFDVLASGGRLLTDDVQGLDEIVRPVLPAGRLARFTTPEELRTLLAEDSTARYDRATLRALSEHVRTEHSFPARAATLLADVLAHRAASGT